ncbi:MAG: M48 family metalloprotease [Phycisphaerae bacterium]
MEPEPATAPRRAPCRYRFTGDPEHSPAGFGYRLAAAVVALCLLLLPLAYLAIIAAVGYGVYYHATHHAGILLLDTPTASARSYVARTYAARLLVYVAPLVAGPIVVVFMFKPLFARRVDEEIPLTLEREHEPRLYEFLEALCERIGAPLPRRISVFAGVNAAASLGDGLRSLFGRRLELVIGLPLLEGLSLTQFAGVMAHELAHLRQGAGMRLTWVICRMTDWLERVAMQRDAWDAWLEGLRARLYHRLALVIMFTQLCVWLNRQLLKVLMVIGRVVSAVLLRRQEYDADACEIAVIGSAEFVATMRRLPQIHVAFERVLSDAVVSWQERRVPDNLPSLIGYRAGPPGDRLAPDDPTGIDDTPAGWFASHPSDADRVARALAVPRTGVLEATGRGVDLLSNPAMVAKAVTLRVYRDGFHWPVESQNLQSVRDLVIDDLHAITSAHAIATYYSRAVSPDRPIWPQRDHVGPPGDAGKSRDILRAAAAQSPRAAGQLAALWEALDALAERQQKMQGVAAIMGCGVTRIEWAQFGLTAAPLPELKRQAEEMSEALERDRAKIAEAAKPLRVRLLVALQLAQVPAVRQRLSEQAASAADAARLLACLHRLEEADRTIQRAGRELHLARLAAAVKHDYSADEKIVASAERLLRAQLERADVHFADLAAIGVDLPPGLPEETRADTLGGYLVPQRPSRRDAASLDLCLATALRRRETTYLHCLGMLAILAGEVERALKIGGAPAAISAPLKRARAAKRDSA